MSTFADDPDAQARYAERFGARDRAAEVSIGPSTPGFSFADRQTWNQILAGRGTGGPLEPAGPPAIVGGLEPETFYAESGGRLSNLLRNRPPTTLAP